MPLQDTLARVRQARRVVVKVGSAVLGSAAKQGFDRPVMAGLAQQLATLIHRGLEVTLVSSGAILAGAQLLGEPLPVRHIGLKQALAAIGQVELMRRWTEIFGWYDVRVAQILLTRDDLGARHRFINARRTLSHVLERSILPIINENDSVLVEEIKLGDNDQLSALITNLVGADLLILLTEVDGLYTADPKRDPNASFIRQVAEVTPSLLAQAGDPGPAGRGGMRSKLEAARRASLFGVPTAIANGRTPEVVTRLLEGEAIGTLVEPRVEHLDSRKHWIAFSQPPAGRLLLDEGAIRAVLHQGRSLLPSGVVAVRGEFDMGDLVEIASEAGAVLGRGITFYSAAEIDKIRGQKSSQIEPLLGYKTADEVIHRDHLVVDPAPVAGECK